MVWFQTTVIKFVIIFLLMEGLDFSLQRMQHLWSTRKTKHGCVLERRVVKKLLLLFSGVHTLPTRMMGVYTRVLTVDMDGSRKL